MSSSAAQVWRGAGDPLATAIAAAGAAHFLTQHAPRDILGATSLLPLLLFPDWKAPARLTQCLSPALTANKKALAICAALYLAYQVRPRAQTEPVALMWANRDFTCVLADY